MHEGGGRWVGSNKVVELKKKRERERNLILLFSIFQVNTVFNLYKMLQYLGYYKNVYKK